MKKRPKIDAKPSHQQSSCVENSMNQESIKNPEPSDEKMNNQEQMKKFAKLIKPILGAIPPLVIYLNSPLICVNQTYYLPHPEETTQGERTEVTMNDSCNNPKPKTDDIILDNRQSQDVNSISSTDTDIDRTSDITLDGRQPQ